jgi:hypothetical protein
MIKPIDDNLQKALLWNHYFHFSTEFCFPRDDGRIDLENKGNFVVEGGEFPSFVEV